MHGTTLPWYKQTLKLVSPYDPGNLGSGRDLAQQCPQRLCGCPIAADHAGPRPLANSTTRIALHLNLHAHDVFSYLRLHQLCVLNA